MGAPGPHNFAVREECRTSIGNFTSTAFHPNVRDVSRYAPQAIICSHSPEILAMAFDDPRCKLFNLVNSRLVSPILSGDKDDLFVAIDSLGGASLDDILFSRGTFYVEGRDDEKILTEAMASELSKLKIVRMSGRANVEGEIQRIQQLDIEGKVDNSHYFIFDLDRKPTSLQGSTHVRLSVVGQVLCRKFHSRC